MPKHHKTFRVKGGPQGDDAWFDVRHLEYGERGDILRQMNEIGDRQRQANADGEYDKAEQCDREGLGLLAAYIVKWNWVGDDSKALPLPSEEIETVYGVLNSHEQAFLLTETMNGLFAASRLKN